MIGWLGGIGSQLPTLVTQSQPHESVYGVLRAALQPLVEYAEQDPQRMRALKGLAGLGGRLARLQESRKEQWLLKLSAAVQARDRHLSPAQADLYVQMAFTTYDWAMLLWVADPARVRLGSLLDQGFALLAAGSAERVPEEHSS